MTHAIQADAPGAPRTLWAVWPAMLGLSAVFLVEMLDNSMLNVALPTIGRDLGASATGLQWVTGAYTVTFGSLMLLFGGLADRFGRRRVMFAGLVLLALASVGTLLARTTGELIAVRALMGVAAAMTAPGSMALAFRMFSDESLRVRATTVISTVGLVGIAVGPTVGGLLLAVVPWQALLVANAPIALVSLLGIRSGIPADTAADLHRDPLDVAGAALGTLTIVLALVAPTLFVEGGGGNWLPWACAAGALLAGGAFIARERRARHPLVDLALIARPMVASGLAFKAAIGLATAGLGYTVTLQLQLAWGWSPAHAAVGMFPMVITMLVTGPLVERVVARVGMGRATTLGGAAIVAGLVIYAVLGRVDYAWIALALVIVAAGLRVSMLTSALSVMGGLPPERTSLGAALVDTASEVSNAVGVAITGTVIAAMLTGSIASERWSAAQVGSFEDAVTVATLGLAALAVVILVRVSIGAGRASGSGPIPSGA